MGTNILITTRAERIGLVGSIQTVTLPHDDEIWYNHIEQWVVTQYCVTALPAGAKRFYSPPGRWLAIAEVNFVGIEMVLISDCDAFHRSKYTVCT